MEADGRSMRREYKALNIGKIQDWILQRRFDPKETLTINKAVSTGMIRGINKVNGIKLCGTVDEERYGKLPALTIHLSRFSKAASEAVIGAGGTCLSVYHNDLALRQELQPHKFKGARAIKPAGPTRRKEIGQSIDVVRRGNEADSVRRILHQPRQFWISLRTWSERRIIQEQRMEPRSQTISIQWSYQNRCGSTSWNLASVKGQHRSQHLGS